MGRKTWARLPHAQGLNQALLYSQGIPKKARLEARELLRALRSALRMSQAQLARRAGVAQAHIARIERGRLDPRLGTLKRLFAAMYCELTVLPWSLKKPTQWLGERRVVKPYGRRTWDVWPHEPAS